MSSFKWIICCLVCFLSSANAQVNRCVNPKTGAISYSDTICDSRLGSTSLEDRKTAAELQQSYGRAGAARERFAQQQANEQAIQAISQPDVRPMQANKSESFACKQIKKRP